MNRFNGVGRLTKDPEVRTTSGENTMTVARFNVALDRKGKKEGEQTADFVPCVAFGKTAEFISKYFVKGSKIGFSGHLQSGSYTNKDGVKVYTLDVIIDDCEFVESKVNSSVEGGKTQLTGKDGFMTIPDDVSDDSLPFN